MTIDFGLPDSTAERGLATGLAGLGAALLGGGVAAWLVHRFRLPVLAIPALAFGGSWVAAEYVLPAARWLCAAVWQ